MSQKFNIIGRLILAFSVTTILAIILSLAAFKSISVLSDTATDMHSHPLAVSNAVLKANVQLVAIHRSMKDVVLAGSEAEIEAALNQVEEAEKEVLQSLQIAQELLLGDQGQVTRAIRSIHDWRPIREEVTSLARSGQIEAAVSITRGKGEMQLALIEWEMEELSIFARTKAEEFRLNARQESSDVLLYMGALLLSIILVNIGIAIAVIRWTNKQVDNHNMNAEALQASERRYRELYEHSPLGYQSLDSEGNFIESNTSLCGLLGYEKNEVIGKWFGDFLTNESAEKFRVNFPRFKARGRVSATPFDMVAKDGKVISVEIDGRIGHDERGDFKQTHCVIQDVTERRQAQEELRRSEYIVNNSSDMMSLVNTDFVYLAVNQVFANSFGKSREYFIGKRVAEVFEKDFFESVALPYYERCLGGEDVNYQMWLEFPVGGRRYLDISYSRYVDSVGNVKGVVIIARNITNLKLAEEELKEHRNHLEKLVELRTQQLTDSQHVAEVANLAKSVFLANMSHEIRTPMNAIIGLTHLMQEAELTPGQSVQLGKINNSAEHLLRVINNILDISKIEAGKLQIEQSDFNLMTVLEDVYLILSDSIQSKGLVMKVETGSVPVWLNGDSTRLRQCLLNFSGNAIKFTTQGTITLRISQLQENSDGVLLRFEVQDTGIGIAADKLTDLFQPFEQADASTTRKHGGSGLGLAINKHLAQLMGGEVGVESELEKGSTFWLTARFCHGKGIQPLMVADVDGPPIRDFTGARVLLVEDNAINSEVATALLGRVGIVADLAENGRAAIASVTAGVYDLILMDVQMPEMDGLEATRAIRSMEGCMADSEISYRHVPILAMTANVYEEDRQACLQAGMNDFLGKPVNPNELYKMISKWLNTMNKTDESSNPPAS